MQLLQPLRALGQDAFLGGTHRLLGEGRLHAQATGVDLGGIEPEPEQLLLDHGEHEAALAAVLVAGLGLGQLRQLPVVLVCLGRVEGAHRDHAPHHVVVALDQGVAPVRSAVGAQVVGRVQDGREHRGLRHRELLGRLAEVGVGGGLHAVGAATEVDGVQVALEDRFLGLLLLHLQREERLLDLARERPLLAEVEDLHVLLRDRRRPLRRVALRVGERRPQDALRVDAAVGVEGAVLRSDRSVLHRLRDVGERDRLTVLLGEPADLGLPARVVHEGRLRLEGLVGVGDLGVLVGEVEDPGQHQDPDDRGDREPLQHRLQALVLPRTLSRTLSRTPSRTLARAVAGPLA